MSIFAFTFTPTTFDLVSDTAVNRIDGTPAGERPKFVLVPHLKCGFFHSGIKGFADGFENWISGESGLAVKGIDDVLRLAPAALRKLYADDYGVAPASMLTEESMDMAERFVAWGWSDTSDGIVAAGLDSFARFEPRRFQHGVFTLPELTADRLPAGMDADGLCALVRSIYSHVSQAGEGFVGGGGLLAVRQDEAGFSVRHAGHVRDASQAPASASTAGRVTPLRGVVTPSFGQSGNRHQRRAMARAGGRR